MFLGLKIVRRLMYLVVSLLVLLVVVDRLGAHLTADELAGRAQKSEHLAAKPDVVIHGFPFLTQVVSGRYGRIDATVKDLATPLGLRIAELHVELHGVHVAFRDVLHGDVRRVPVERGDATARIAYAALDAAIAAQVPGGLLAITTSDAGGGRVGLAGRYTGLGGPVTISGVAGVDISGGRFRVTPVPGTLNALPLVVRTRVAALLTVSYPLPTLPFDVRIQSATAVPDGVQLTATGEHLVLVRPFP
jgi:hypothetical protein